MSPDASWRYWRYVILVGFKFQPKKYPTLCNITITIEIDNSYLLMCTHDTHALDNYERSIIFTYLAGDKLFNETGVLMWK